MKVWYEVRTYTHRHCLTRITITDKNDYISEIIQSTNFFDGQSRDEAFEAYENLQRKRDLFNQVPLAGLIWELRKDGR